MKGGGQAFLLAVVVGTACREPQPTTAGGTGAMTRSAVAVPGAWRAAGVPAEGLVRGRVTP